MSKVPTATQPLHAATGLPGPPEWAGYWTFVTAIVLVGFVLFLAGKGTLGTWLGFLNLGNIRGLSLGNDVATTPLDPNAPGKDAVPGFPGVSVTKPFAGLPDAIGKYIPSWLGGSGQ